jgi:nitrate/nitrite transporter NarK
MIENHYELNIAYAGSHYARVIFSSGLDEKGAQLKAHQISEAMKNGLGAPSNWNFSLTYVTCFGTGVEFEK